MFQYFVFFQFPHEIGFEIPPIELQIRLYGGFGNCKEFQNENKPTERTNSDVKSRRMVKFLDKPIIRLMHTWQFAHKQARKDLWQRVARDRTRFERKINILDRIISPVLEKKMWEIYLRSKKKNEVTIYSSHHTTSWL